MIKKLYSERWNYKIYQVNDKLVASVVFFGQVDYTRSFYIQADQVSAKFELLDDLAEKIRNGYEDFKAFEVVPAILNEKTDDSIKADIFARECFYLKTADHYYFKPNYKVSGDIREDLKTLLSIYSAGLELTKVDEFLFKIISQDYSKINWTLNEISDYYLAITLLSFIKIRFPNTEVSVIQKIVPFEEDRLLSFIALDQEELDYSKTILVIDPYIYMLNSLADRNSIVENINVFLSHFYQAFAGISWHDSHIKLEESFFGYWSVCLAAIVQKLNLDDHLFMDHMYYPRDLINKELLPTWEDSERGEKARTKKTVILDEIRANKPEISSQEIKQMVVAEYEEMLNAKNKDIFSSSFRKQVKLLQESDSKTSKEQSAKAIKSFVRDFATDITQEADENHPFNQLLNNDELKAQISKVISETKEIEGIDLEKELLDFFDKDIDVKIQKEQLQKFQQLGFSLLELDEKYTEEDEGYWDELEQLFQPFQTVKTDPMIELKNSIAETITNRLNPNGKAINFNFSIDDFL